MKFFRPNKSDINQIEALVNLGANEADICSVLGVSQLEIEHWKRKNQKVNILLKPKSNPEFNLHHPEYATQIEEAFVCGGKRFYRFKEEYDMPLGRYKYFLAHFREVELRMSNARLKEYVDTFEGILNGGKKGDRINIGKCFELVSNLKTRLALGWDPNLVKKVAAVAYFDETEDLSTFKESYGQEKIKLWEEHNVLDFFLTKPIGELIGLNSSSVESLQDYLKTAEETIELVNSGLLRVSEESSSEDGKNT